MNFLKNITIRSATTGLSVLMIAVALGISFTALIILYEVRGTSETWQTYEQITARKADHLSDLRASLGYGGVIHLFKNFILRKDRFLIVEIQAKMLDATVELTAYSALGMTGRESKAITVLEETLTSYLDAIAEAELLASKGIPSHVIDVTVRIDDGPALDALEILSEELLMARRSSSKRVYDSVSRVSTELVATMLIVGGLTFVLVLWFFWFSKVQFINPLLKLGQAMKGLAEGDVYSVVPFAARPNELGDMARTIEIFRENMIRRQEAEEELLQIQHELEQRVEERTEASFAAMKEAESANQAKSEFLSSMSHELRTPLNAMLGFTQILNADWDKTLTVKQKNATEHVLKAGDHLMKLIDDVLNLAQIESGNLSLDIETVDPTAIIQDCANITHNLAEQKGLTFYDRTPGWTLPEISIDKTRFQQVILNLLSNAVKYNRDGGTVTLSVGEGRDGALRITVTDTGHGIAGEKQSQLFTPFSRLGLENSDITGTGIGLTITKELTEAMGGAIGFESSLNLGSRFWLDFPVMRGELAPRAPEDLPADGRGGGAVREGKYTVLYVEDNPSSLNLVETIIGRIPETVMISAHTGELGVDLAEIYRPDVILMDIDLPGIDGFEALKRLNSSPATKNIPVIALTAKASGADKDRGIKAGFQAYLTKPVNVEEVERTVTEHLVQKVKAVSVSK